MSRIGLLSASPIPPYPRSSLDTGHMTCLKYSKNIFWKFLIFFLFYSKKYVIHLQSFFSINEHQTFIKYVENMWNAWILLFRQFKLMQNLSSKLSFYINVFHMFSTFFISIWSLFTENNLCRCITYFLLKNKKEIKNFQKIFLEYSNTNYLDMCPVGDSAVKLTSITFD